MIGHHRWNHTWAAFTATTVSAVYVIAGFSGYQLNRRARFLAPEAWTDGVIWWQVGAGLAVIPVALYFWRKGSREIDRHLGRRPGPPMRPATDRTATHKTATPKTATPETATPETATPETATD